jgi:hypothetical protein
MNSPAPELLRIIVCPRDKRTLREEGKFLVCPKAHRYRTAERKGDRQIVLPEIRRVLSDGGEAVVQLPNIFGLRSLYHEFRRGFRAARDFEVRYWTIPVLKAIFSRLIGPLDVTVDDYFSLNAQVSDAGFMPRQYRAIVYTSECLRRLSAYVAALRYVADSLYISALRKDSGTANP